MANTPLKLGLIADPPSLVLIYKTRTDAGNKSKRRKRKIPLRNFNDTTNVIKYIDAVIRARHKPYLEDVSDVVIQKLLRIIQLVQKGHSIEASIIEVDEELGLGPNLKLQGEPHEPDKRHELQSVDKKFWTEAEEIETGVQISSSPAEPFEVTQIRNEESRAYKYVVNRDQEPSGSDADEDDLDVKSISFSISLKKTDYNFSTVRGKQEEDTVDESSANHKLTKDKAQIQNFGKDETSPEIELNAAENSPEDSGDESGSGSELDDDDTNSKAKFTDNLFSIFQPPKSRVEQLKSLKSPSALATATDQSKELRPRINIRHFVQSTSATVRSTGNNSKNVPNPNLPDDKSKSPTESKQDVPGVLGATPGTVESEAHSPFWSSFRTNARDDYVSQLPKSVKFNLGAKIMNSQSMDSNNDDNEDSGSDKLEQFKPTQDSANLERDKEQELENRQTDGETEAVTVQSFETHETHDQSEEAGLFFKRSNHPQTAFSNQQDLEPVFDSSVPKKNDDDDDDSDGFW